MPFIGQEKIWKELNIILEQIRPEQNNLPSFLLRAPSGYGKTIMSFMMATYLVGRDYWYLLPQSDGNVSITLNKKVYVIDEVHTCKNQELFYPLIDSGKYIFIFTTNEAGELKEPLQNRCLNYIFSPYSDKELNKIVDLYLNDKIKGFDYYRYFTDYTKCPRVINKLCQRLNYIFNTYGIPKQESKFKDVFENVLNIRNGLDEEQIRYLRFLLEVKTASLDLISLSTGIDKATI
ncbi:MAG TPA: hypothetical protein PLC53_03650 [Bacilli bacterium]|nr:hypothetical protein [Bacilli bacterium]